MAQFECLTDPGDGTADSSTLLYQVIEAQDENGGFLSQGEVRDNIRILLFAGFETSAVSMTWTMFLLAKHPHVLAKVASYADEQLIYILQLREEVDPVMLSDLSPNEKIEKMPYVLQVIEESLRLKPTLGGLPTRETIADNQEMFGAVFPKGSVFDLSVIRPLD